MTVSLMSVRGRNEIARLINKNLHQWMTFQCTSTVNGKRGSATEETAIGFCSWA